MQRILVIGSGGAGKSTFSRQLGQLLSLPVIHLDSYFWRPGWNRVGTDEWEQITDSLMAGNRWIMDGNYGSTMEKRIKRADTVIFLYLSRIVCLYGALKRRITRIRPDIIPGCKESVDLEFLQWIWTYPRKRAPGVLERLRLFGEGKRIVILRSRRQVKEFLQEMGGVS